MLKNSMLLFILFITSCSTDLVNHTTIITNNSIINVDENLNDKSILKTKNNYIITNTPIKISNDIFFLKNNSNKNMIVSTDNKQISLDDESPMIFKCFNNNIYYSSNFLSNNYLNIYNVKRKETIKLKLNNYLVDHFIVKDDKLYLMLSKNNLKKHYLAVYDSKSHNINIIKNIDDELNPQSNPLIINDNLYYTTIIKNTNYLVKQNLKSNKQNKTKLNNEFSMISDYDIKQKKFFLINCDTINNSGFSNSIEIISDDLKSKRVVKIRNNILDLKIVKDYIIILDTRQLLKYNINNIKLIKAISFKDEIQYGNIIIS